MDRDSNELSHDGEITFKQNVLFAQVHSSSTKYLYRYNKTTLVIIFRTTTEMKCSVFCTGALEN